MFIKTSGSSSVLQTPTEHFASLNSPSTHIRARPGSGDGMVASTEKPQASTSGASGLGGGGSDDAGGGSSSARRTHTGAAARRAPAARALRRASWAALQGCLLLATLKYLVPLKHEDKDLYFLYYQPFMPMLAMLWFWATAVRYFERRRIRYDICFSQEDQRYLLRSGDLYQIANVLTAIVLTSGVIFAYKLGSGDHAGAAVHPPLLYAVLLAIFLFPGGLLFRDSRLFFGLTLWRVMTPIRSVTWSDFLLADVLTSLAKALSDTERAVCHLMIGPVMQPDLPQCSDGSFIIPLGLAAPYAWRLVQCIRVYLDTGARPQLYNAIKYSTAFPVILLSSVKYHVDHEVWRNTLKPMWLGAALINSAYSFYWDVERDWEISWFSQMGGANQGMPSPVLRSQLLYRRPFYLYLMASNLLLRLSWTHKLSPHLRNQHFVVFLIVLAEAFRRFQWLFVRIEVELRKIQSQRPDVGMLVPPAGHHHAHSSDVADSGSDDEGEPGPVLPRIQPHSLQRGVSGKQISGGAELELSTKL